MSSLRIIAISGLCVTKCDIWRNVGNAFANEFPDVEFVVEEAPNCQPMEFGRMRELINTIVRKYDDGTDTLLVGHSLGGIVACAASNLMKSSLVRGIVTIFAPHNAILVPYPFLLYGDRNLNFPVITFEAIRDLVLPWGGTRHRQSRVHVRLDSDHLASLITHSDLSRQIAEVTRKELFLAA